VSDELWSFEDSSDVQQASVNEMILIEAGSTDQPGCYSASSSIIKPKQQLQHFLRQLN